MRMDETGFYIVEAPAIIDYTVDMPDCSIPGPAPLDYTVSKPDWGVGDSAVITPSDEDVRFSALLDILSNGNGNGFSASVVAIDENGKADIEFYLDIDGDGQRETYTRAELLEKYTGTDQVVG
jgi:hypothetical protein